MMTKGIPLAGFKGLAMSVATDAAGFVKGRAEDFLSGKAQGPLAAAGYLAGSVACRAIDACDRVVSPAIAVAAFPLTGGGMNPLDLKRVIAATPDIARWLAIRGLDLALQVTETKK